MNSYSRIFARWSSWQRYGLTCCILMVVVLLWWFFCYRFLRHQITVLSSDIDQKTQEQLFVQKIEHEAHQDIKSLYFLSTKILSWTVDVVVSYSIHILSAITQKIDDEKDRLTVTFEGATENVFAFIRDIDFYEYSLIVERCALYRLNDVNITGTLIITW